MNPSSKDFSERLIGLRGLRKKAEFARFLGIPAPMYHRYESGQVPKEANLRVISERCGVTIDWLLNRTGGLAMREDNRPYPMAEAASAPVMPPAQQLDAAAEMRDIRARIARIEAELSQITQMLGAALGAQLRPPASAPYRKAKP